MKATDYGSKNPLRCPVCDEYRFLIIEGVRSSEGDKTLGMKIPFYHCKKCKVTSTVAPHLGLFNERAKAEAYYKGVFKKELASLNEGEFCGLTSPFEKKQFKIHDSLGFKYDSQDYYYIPGLLSMFDSDEGFLTPVYFDKKVLLYYNSLPDYRVVLSSFSRVHIVDSKGQNLIPHGFGINRNDKVICWLGDLNEVFSKPENEQHKKMFLAFNVDSDHDIVSDYYFNQIEANFMESDNEHKIFDLRNEFDKKMFEKFGLNLTQINFNELINDYKHPIINEPDQINLAYKKLTSMLLESLVVDNLRTLLKNAGIDDKDMKGLQGLKLFEMFLLKVLKQDKAKEIVCPMFVLYDLRVLGEHLKGSKSADTLKSCKARLNIPDTATDLEVFEKLVQDLIKMYETLDKL